MEDNSEYSLAFALLCVQRSLLDAATADLRAVVVDLYEDQWCLFLRFYYDDAVPEEVIELWDCAMTEACAGMGTECFIDDKIERLDFPKPIPFLGPSTSGGYLAFLRWELGGFKLDATRIFPLVQAKEIASYPEAYALLAASNALLGKVSPELRAVTVEVPSGSKILRLRFFHDGEAQAGMIHLWEKAASEIASCMGAEYSSDAQIVRVDFPQKVTIHQGRIAYFRKEPDVDVESK